MVQYSGADSQETIICPKCKRAAKSHYRFCINCGWQLIQPVPPKIMAAVQPPVPKALPGEPKLWQKLLSSPKFLFAASLVAAGFSIFWTSYFLFPDLIKMELPTINDIIILILLLLAGTAILFLVHTIEFLGVKIKEEWKNPILAAGVTLGHLAPLAVWHDKTLSDLVTWDTLPSEVAGFRLFLVVASLWLIVNSLYFLRYKLTYLAGLLTVFTFTTIERLAYSRILESKEGTTLIFLTALLIFGLLWLKDVNDIFGPISWLAAILVGINPHTLSGVISSVIFLAIAILPPFWVLLKSLTKKEILNLPLLAIISSLGVFLSPLAVFSDAIAAEISALGLIGASLCFLLLAIVGIKPRSSLVPICLAQIALLLTFFFEVGAALVLAQLVVLLTFISIQKLVSDKVPELFFVAMTLLASFGTLVVGKNDEIALVLFILAFLPLIGQLVLLKRVQKLEMWSGLVFPSSFLALRVFLVETESWFSVVGLFLCLAFLTVFLVFLYYSGQLTPQEREISAGLGLLLFLLCAITSAIAKWYADAPNLEYGYEKGAILLAAFIMISLIQYHPKTPEIVLLRLEKILFAPAFTAFCYLGSFHELFSIAVVTVFALGHSIDAIHWLKVGQRTNALYLRDGTIFGLIFSSWVIIWWDSVSWAAVEYLLLFVPAIWVAAGIREREVLTKDSSLLAVIPSLGFLAAIVSKDESFSEALSYSNIVIGIFLGLLMLNLIMLSFVAKWDKVAALKLAPVVIGSAFVLGIGIFLTEALVDYWALVVLSLIFIMTALLIGSRWLILDQLGTLILNALIFAMVLLIPPSLAEDFELATLAIIIAAIILTAIATSAIMQYDEKYELSYVMLSIGFCVVFGIHFFEEYIFLALVVLNITMIARFTLSQLFLRRETLFLPYAGLGACIIGLAIVGLGDFPDDLISFLFHLVIALSWFFLTYFRKLMKDAYVRYISVMLSIIASVFWTAIILQTADIGDDLLVSGIISIIGFFLVLAIFNELFLGGEPQTSAILLPTIVLGFPIIFFVLEGSYLVTISFSILSFVCLSIGLRTKTQELKIAGLISYGASFCKGGWDMLVLTSALEKAIGSAVVAIACLGIAIILYVQQVNQKASLD
ncbi:MAG: hypothetical protein ACFFB3_02210 [Candidatus Hodarchaeota archaeon]